MVLPEELREEEGRWQCILFVFLMLWRVCSFLLFLVWLEDITFVHEFEAHGVNSMMLLCCRPWVFRFTCGRTAAMKLTTPCSAKSH